MIEYIKKLPDRFKNFFNKEETLEQKYDAKNNSFDYIKYILAFSVVLFHSYILFYGAGIKPDFITKRLNGVSLGEIAVAGFFIISGFFITQSMIYSKSYIKFIIKRILRIYPALIVSLLLAVVVIGPITTSLPIKEYFNSNVKEYFVGNLNLLGNSQYFIADLFNSNPYPKAINGSIWTIKHEVIGYALILIASLFGILKYRKIMVGTLIVLLIMNFTKFNIPLEQYNYIGIVSEFKFFLKLMAYFVFGSVMYLYKDRIIMSFKFFLLLLLITIFAFILGKGFYILFLTLPYMLIYISIFKPKYNIRKYGDFAYGIYVYSFPIQQLTAWFFKDSIGILKYNIISVTIIIILSVISWYFVEKPCINLSKNKKGA